MNKESIVRSIRFWDQTLPSMMTAARISIRNEAEYAAEKYQTITKDAKEMQMPLGDFEGSGFVWVDDPAKGWIAKWGGSRQYAKALQTD